jgi:glycosyltransferase involved in cell wall biosynthesis
VKDAYDIVMLVLNDVSFDGRVRSEAAALTGAGWRVLIIGTQRADGALPDDEVLPGGADLRRVRYGRFGARLWRPWSWIRHGLQAAQILRTLAPIKAQVFHAHDLPALILLWLARLVRRHPPQLVYDAHELYLFQPRYTSRLARRWHRLTLPLFMALEGFIARRANGVLALGEARARLLSWWYHIPRPLVIFNALDPVIDSSAPPLDVRALIGPGRRCVIHTGDIIDRRRAISELVRAVALLPDDVALVFLGQGESVGSVRALAGQLGITDRVHIVPPVLPEDVPAVIQSADVAAILMRTESWNTRAALPNKLFEAISAGVPVLASDMFVLRRIVQRYQLGLCCDFSDPAALAGGLNQLLTDKAQVCYRARIRAAQGEINQQVEMRKLLAFYQRLLS